MDVTMGNFRQRYNQGLSKGFSVAFVRQYYVDNQSEISPNVEEYIKTPFTCDGRDVVAYLVTDTDIRHERRNGGHRSSAGSPEFWVLDETCNKYQNLDDVYPNGGYQFKDKNGTAVDLKDVSDQVCTFGIASTYHPHVFLYPEYAEARGYMNGRMGLAPVSEKDYEEYLGGIEEQMRGRGAVFVGPINRLSRLGAAYRSMPSQGSQLEVRDGAYHGELQFDEDEDWAYYPY